MHIFTAVKFNLSTLLVGIFLAMVAGYLIGFFLRKLISQYQIKEAEAKKKNIIEKAEQEVESRLKSAAVEAKELALAEKTKAEKEVQIKWDKLRVQERKINQKEDELRGVVREINTIKAEMFEIKSLIKEIVDRNGR